MCQENMENEREKRKRKKTKAKKRKRKKNGAHHNLSIKASSELKQNAHITAKWTGKAQKANAASEHNFVTADPPDSRRKQAIAAGGGIGQSRPRAAAADSRGRRRQRGDSPPYLG